MDSAAIIPSESTASRGATATHDARRSFVALLVVLIALLGAGCEGASPCSTISNVHTGEDVTVSRWPGVSVSINPLDESFQPYTFVFGWCTSGYLNSGSQPSCGSPGMVQLFSAGSCAYNCAEWLSPPAISSSANEVIMFYRCGSKNNLKVQVLCDETAEVLAVNAPYQMQGSLFAVTLAWNRACGDPPAVPIPSQSEASTFAGAAFVIIVFVGGFLYVSIGVAVNYFARGLRGWEMLPHRTFWADVPLLVRDGFRFCWQSCARKCRERSASGYTQM